jgi:hypothetical protein
MTKHLYYILLLIFSQFAFAQVNNSNQNNTGFNTGVVPRSTDTTSTSESKHKAPIDLYKVITIDRDTTYIDTTLTIRKDYIFNYLRRDNFGLLPFANEGQTYNTLHFSLKNQSILPQFGFTAKHFNYLEASQIKYYSVPTPLTELYFKTVMEQGQSLDAFVTLNTSERLNFSIAYKGLRSVGKFINQLSSSGNFRFSASYNTKNTRYFLKTHIVVQDIFNGENGGIVSNTDFESKDDSFTDRARLQVHLRDASTLLKGNRYFMDHLFRVNPKEANNNLFINYQFNLENKFFNYSQKTVPTTITIPNQANQVYNRFGQAFVTTNLSDFTNYENFFNKIGAIYENKTLGKFEFFIDNTNYKYFYKTTFVAQNQIIPSSIDDRITNIGGKYLYQKGKWNGVATLTNSITKQQLRNLEINATYTFDADNEITFHFQNANTAPNLNQNFYQSSYIGYNWINDFKNQKIINFSANATTKWLNATFELSSIKDYIYFSQNITAVTNTQIVTPKQFSDQITNLSIKLSREITYGSFALDNTILLQKTTQSQNILNVPQLVARNTLYYTDTAFKNAMEFQTGIIFNIFSSYYANDYNPVIGEFFVQEQRKIGNFPLLDLFFNAKVRQTRIYFKAEHFNSSFSKANFYAAPSYPYRDFIIRFGLVWNFFQ